MEKWLPILMPIIIAFLTIVAFPWLKEQIAKMKDERLKGFAETAMGVAEETARNHAKENGGNKMDQTAKMGVAKNHLKSLAEAAGYKMDDEQAQKLIEAALGLLALQKKR